MSTLQIYIPETGLPAEDGPVLLPWVLRGSRGEPGRAGRSEPAQLPKADHCELIVPASVVLLTQVNVPPARGQKLRQLLPFAVEDRVLSDPENIHVAAGARLPSGATPVAVIEKSWVATVLSVLGAAGLRPQRMLVETCMPDIEPGTWCLVWNGREGFARTGPASGMALDGARSNEAPMALVRAVGEARERGELPGELVLRPSSRSATVPDLAAWSEELGVPVVLGDKWSWARQPVASEVPLNLLQGEFAPASGFQHWLPRLKPVAILLGLILALQGVASVIQWWSLVHERNALSAQMEGVFRATFPDAKVVVDAPLQMRRKLSEARLAGGVPDAADFLPLLAQATPLLKGVGARIRAMDYAKGSLRVEITVNDTAALDQLRGRLVIPGAEARVELVNARPGSVDARLTVTAGAGS